MRVLHSGFKDVTSGAMTFEQCRDRVRDMLHNDDADAFPYGHAGTSAVTLAKYMLECLGNRDGVRMQQCTDCEYNNSQHTTSLLWDMYYRFQGTTQQWLNKCQLDYNEGRCPQCHRGHVASARRYETAPPLLAINTEGQNIPIDSEVCIESEGDYINTYKLSGIIYFGEFHFVARLIDKASTVWYYDGACSNTLRGSKEGKLADTNKKDLLHAGSKKATLVMYVLDRTERMTSD